MGISYDEFWTLNPRKLKVYVSGYKLKRKIDDEKAWMLGGYLYEAFAIAISNAFSKKNAKTKTYFETREKPFLDDGTKRELTQDEKQKYIDSFVAGLKTMQSNFNAEHKIKGR